MIDFPRCSAWRVPTGIAPRPSSAKRSSRRSSFAGLARLFPGARRLVGEVAAPVPSVMSWHYLKTEKPNLLFVHLSDPDSAGHSSGWMSAAYGRAVQATDKALDNSSTRPMRHTAKTTIQSWSSQSRRPRLRHGTSDVLDVTIPWMPGARRETTARWRTSRSTRSTPRRRYCGCSEWRSLRAGRRAGR